MNQRPLSTRLFIAALAMLLAVGLSGLSRLVLCVGTDGHRAIEPEHAATGCPTLFGSQDTLSISVREPAACFDLPTAGASPVALSSSDAERVPMPPLVPFLARLDAVPRAEAPIPASTHARAGPPGLALHLTSTILLV